MLDYWTLYTRMEPTLRIERLPYLTHEAILFLENVFSEEQNIPKELVPLKSKEQEWWCIKSNDEIVGTVAGWKVELEWHWGRLAIHKKLRGLGMGKKLVWKSLDDLFKMDVEKVRIDARDLTVGMLLKIGGKVTGSKSSFYGYPITPMEIAKKDFYSENPS